MGEESKDSREKKEKKDNPVVSIAGITFALTLATSLGLAAMARHHIWIVPWVAGAMMAGGVLFALAARGK